MITPPPGCSVVVLVLLLFLSGCCSCPVVVLVRLLFLSGCCSFPVVVLAEVELLNAVRLLLLAVADV